MKQDMIRERALALHQQSRGKLEIQSTVPLETREDLSLAYTPGVAEPCMEIHRDVSKAYEYTRKWNMVAVVSDGTAVLGLGDIGPEASMPVMEGKAVLFKAFGNVDAVPICLNTTDVDEIVDTVTRIAPTFGGINLEDIAAPRCFEIERKLKERLNIPVFHDDQHGTAIVVLAGVINALQIVDKTFDQVKVVIVGAGSAGIACGKLLMEAGVQDLLMCDRVGILYDGIEGVDWSKQEMGRMSNPHNIQGGLAEAVADADILIGVSGPGVVTPEMIRQMADDAIVFAMANPVPEIYPADAKAAGARVVGTGRSDFPNQVNNVLAFPGIFRGALDARALQITESMKLAAAYAIADIAQQDGLQEDRIIPDPLDPRVCDAVAAAVRHVVESDHDA